MAIYRKRGWLGRWLARFNGPSRPVRRSEGAISPREQYQANQLGQLGVLPFTARPDAPIPAKEFGRRVAGSTPSPVRFRYDGFGAPIPMYLETDDHDHYAPKTRPLLRPQDAVRWTEPEERS